MSQAIDTVKNIIRGRFNTALDGIIGELRDELQQQGHRASGSLDSSFRHEITENDMDGFLGVIFANDYWGILEDGVKPSRVPYTPGKKSGASSSKYIQGLLDWAAIVRPELEEKERKGFVFAIATKHSMEGNPTLDSYLFSKNEERTGFVQRTIDKHVGVLAIKIAGGDFAGQVVSEIIKSVFVKT